MNLSEKKLYDRLKDNLVRFDFQRVETSTGTGVPDVNFCCPDEDGKGREGWIELKALQRPMRTTTPIRVKWRPGQIPWITRRVKHGGRVWILIQLSESLYLFDGDCAIDLGTPIDQRKFHNLAYAYEPSRRWNYEMLGEKLME